VYDKTTDAGPQDVVVLAVKAHQVAAIAADLAALCHDETAIVTMQNGIPWWYFHKHGGAHEGTPVRSADPDGSIARLIDANRVIGSVVYPAATLEAPGVVHVVEGRRFTLGEPDGSTSARAQAISAAFTRAGFKAPVIGDIRSEIWLKLWGI
jgi:2-dehydropantoate 2-reductase